MANMWRILRSCSSQLTNFRALPRLRNANARHESIRKRWFSEELASLPESQDQEPPTETPTICRRKRRLLRKMNVKSSLPPKYNCSGCGAVLQSLNPQKRGFLPKEKLREWHELVDNPSEVMLNGGGEADESGIVQGSREPEESSARKGDDGNEFTQDIEEYFPEKLEEDTSSGISSLVCKRCFSLKNYNSALKITLEQDDYLRHVQIIKEKRALLVLVLDVTDVPSCIFPDLRNLISSKSSVLIVANKIDLLPTGQTANFWLQFKNYLAKECIKTGMPKSSIAGVRFVSVKEGRGVHELAEEIVKKWGNRGDVYLLGCTNVGKSSLFNKLLVQLCGSKPGELNMDNNLLAPQATISLWPGTTLGLLSFPLMSVGKRRRLLARQRARDAKVSLGFLDPGEEYSDEGDAFHSFLKNEDLDYKNDGDKDEELQPVDPEEIMDKYRLRKRRVVNRGYEPPQNRFWLHDTPGSINESQLINHLSTKELTLGLPKKPLKPKSFILRPGQCLFLGGLARLDYVQGPISIYFTFFTWSYLNIHATKIENADALYERHLGSAESIFKLPMDTDTRGAPFPKLEGKTIEVNGIGWKESAMDVILSSAGWVAVTAGHDVTATLKVYTPLGKGIHVRQPALFPDAINQRGKRERYGTKTAYRGLPKKHLKTKK